MSTDVPSNRDKILAGLASELDRYMSFTEVERLSARVAYLTATLHEAGELAQSGKVTEIALLLESVPDIDIPADIDWMDQERSRKSQMS